MNLFTNTLAFLIRLTVGVTSFSAHSLPRGRLIFFSNHSSHLDALIIWAALPASIRSITSPVAAADYWNTSRLKKWVSKHVFQAVFLERKGRGHDGGHPLETVCEAIRAGRNVIIFPEGTRSVDGDTKEFKPGLHYLAESFPEVSLMPVYLENLNRILPKGEVLPIPILGRIRIYPPLERIENEDRDSFLKRARKSIMV